MVSLRTQPGAELIVTARTYLDRFLSADGGPFTDADSFNPGHETIENVENAKILSVRHLQRVKNVGAEFPQGDVCRTARLLRSCC